MMIHVVSGALVRDGKVLMGLRKKEGMRPDLWELPGGKVDKGEDPRTALVREWYEECGCVVTTGPLITVASLRLDVLLVVDLYEVMLTPSDFGPNHPQVLDHQKHDWVAPAYAMRSLPCSPAFYLHYFDLNLFVEARSSSVPGPQGWGMRCEKCQQSRCTSFCPACDKCDHDHP